MNETAAIYSGRAEQPSVDASNMFLGGHSLGALLALVEAPHIQPKAAFGWSTALTMLFQAGQRTRTMRGPTERGWTSTDSSSRANYGRVRRAWTSSRW